MQNRRKAIIYVSNGYDFNPFEKARAGEDRLFGDSEPARTTTATSDMGDQMRRQGQQFADADLARELSELTRAANRANATFYTIDPRGLVGGPDLDENDRPGRVEQLRARSRRTACA